MTTKNKYIDIYLSPYELYNFDVFMSKLGILNNSVRYSILFRVCYDELNQVLNILLKNL